MQAGADAVDLLAGLQAERAADPAAPGGVRSRAERHSTTPELVHAGAHTCGRGRAQPTSPKLFPIFRPKMQWKVLQPPAATAWSEFGHVGGGDCAESNWAGYALHFFCRFGGQSADWGSAPVASLRFVQLEARQLSSLCGTPT